MGQRERKGRELRKRKRTRNRLGEIKGIFDLTLRYKPLSSPSEDMTMTAFNLDASLLGK